MELSRYVRQTVRGDINYLAPRLRPADRQEIEAVTGKKDQEEASLLKGYETSDVCSTFLTPEGNPAGMFGVVAPSGHWGRIWLLATPDIERWPKLFIRYSRPILGLLNIKYPILYNVVDTRNTVHIRWLKWSGFRFMHRIQHNATEFQFFMKGGTNPLV